MPRDLDPQALDLAQAFLRDPEATATRLSFDPETVEHDLARIVLALVEALRQLMELQAIRRMEAGTLTEAEEERLGTALCRARDRILEIAAGFGLSEPDLVLDLGPLGRL